MDEADQTTPAGPPIAVKRVFACGDCGEKLRYGTIVVRIPEELDENGKLTQRAQIMCENCAKRRSRAGEKFAGQAVVHGVTAKEPSSVDRARALQRVKKLKRMKKRGS